MISGSKFGWHIITHNINLDTVRRVIAETNPRVIKVVTLYREGVELVEWAAREFPNAYVILRVAWDDGAQPVADQLLHDTTQTPEQVAQLWVSKFEGAFAGMWPQVSPMRIMVESLNEMLPSTPDQMRRFGQFEAARMRILADKHGFGSAFGAWSIGTPDIAMWQYYEDAFQAAHSLNRRYSAPVAVLTLHEGTQGPAWNGYEASPDRYAYGWLGFRYRRLLHQHLVPRGLYVPIILSEWGWWPEGSYNREAWLDLVKWHDAQVATDPAILGVTPYTWGGSESEMGWDISGFLEGPDGYIEYLKAGWVNRPKIKDVRSYPWPPIPPIIEVPPEQPPEPTPDYPGGVYVTLPNLLNVRQAPGVGAAIVSQVARGTPLQVLEVAPTPQNGYTWVKVKVAIEATGYVAAKYIRPK